MYAFARLSPIDLSFVRIGGPGLGNLLLPWARALVASRNFSMTPIWPTWPQLKIGPVLRRERDKRLYADLFRRSERYVGGLQKAGLLYSARRISSEDYLLRPHHDERAVVTFSGMGGYFSEIIADSSFIRAELCSITRKNHLAAIPEGWTPSIAIHVRLGDFLVPAGQDSRFVGSSRIELAWYISAVNRLRAELGSNVPAHVFSDGTDEELAELLNLPQIERVTFGSSISDIHAMSRARVLIASASTFSMWASFLGRMPVVWKKGALAQRLYGGTSSEVEVESGAPLPRDFVSASDVSLRRRS